METRTVWRCFGIGLICGLRSMTGPAAARWRAGDPARLAFAALAAGELIADKLPGTPPRTIPPALAFRAVAGGFAGRSVAASFAGNYVAGALAGVAGAMVAAYVGMSLRSQIVQGTRLPDPIVAVVEDVIAIYGAIAVTQA